MHRLALYRCPLLQHCELFLPVQVQASDVVDSRRWVIGRTAMLGAAQVALVWCSMRIWTPSKHCGQNGNIECVRLLLAFGEERGIDVGVNTPRLDGTTPLLMVS